MTTTTKKEKSILEEYVGKIVRIVPVNKPHCYYGRVSRIDDSVVQLQPYSMKPYDSRNEYFEPFKYQGKVKSEELAELVQLKRRKQKQKPITLNAREIFSIEELVK